MADLDFSNYQGPVKNPFAGGGPVLAPRKVSRINVSREAVVTVKQVEVLAKVIQNNDLLAKAISCEIDDRFSPKVVLRGGGRTASVGEGHLAEVLAVAMQILHQND